MMCMQLLDLQLTAMNMQTVQTSWSIIQQHHKIMIKTKRNRSFIFVLRLDINECLTGTHNCDNSSRANCINTQTGSGFRCECHMGFSTNDSGQTCFGKLQHKSVYFLILLIQNLDNQEKTVEYFCTE